MRPSCVRKQHGVTFVVSGNESRCHDTTQKDPTMNTFEVTHEYIASVKVTTQTYDLYRDTFIYDNGEKRPCYTLRSPKNEKKYWAGHNLTSTDNSAAGTYMFSTVMGTPIKRQGNIVKFFIAGDIIERVH